MDLPVNIQMTDIHDKEKLQVLTEWGRSAPPNFQLSPTGSGTGIY